MIREDVARGEYDSVDHFVEAAVLAMHQCRGQRAIEDKSMRDAVEAGWLSSERGPLYSESEVTDYLEAEIPGLKLRDAQAA